jgi:SAM-dependent methyltransferase
VTDQGERYDRIAAGYLRWWAPVLVPDAVATLELVAGDVAAGARRILDLGTGTGTLGLAAVERWPGVRVTGIDASTEMAHAADLEADRRLGGPDRARFESAVGYAGELPFDDATFDLVVSSFVLQLVPSRARALREARRVLRPGGRVAFVTWLAGGDRFAGDEIFDRVLDEAGIGARDDEENGAPDIASPEAAAQGLRRAGFRKARATGATLEHRFGVDGYVGFLEAFDEEDLFAGLVERKRARLVARLRERLAALSEDDLVLRLPIVRATAVVPGG